MIHICAICGEITNVKGLLMLVDDAAKIRNLLTSITQHLNAKHPDVNKILARRAQEIAGSVTVLGVLETIVLTPNGTTEAILCQQVKEQTQEVLKAVLAPPAQAPTITAETEDTKSIKPVS